jgi:hypothetical protein
MAHQNLELEAKALAQSEQAMEGEMQRVYEVGANLEGLNLYFNQLNSTNRNL